MRAHTRTRPTKAAEAPEALEARRVVRAGRRRALQHLLLAARALVARVCAVAPEPGTRRAQRQHPLPPPRRYHPAASPRAFRQPAARSPIDQVVAHAPVSARLTLAFVQVQLAAGTPVAWRAHAAVGAHTVQARAPVQAGR